MKREPRTVSVLGALVLTGVLSGCIQSAGCPAWPRYDSPSAIAEEAQAVVLGEVTGVVGSTTVYGARANVWAVSVDEWEKGDGPAQIEVISTPSSCSDNGDPYFGTDPVEAASSEGRVALFLSDHDGRWMTANPTQGIVMVGTSDVLPDAWPDDHR